MSPALRALLDVTASQAAWEALCVYLDALYASAPDAVPAAVQACEAAVWPVGHEPAWSWLDHLEAGTVVPMMRLVGRIDSGLSDAALSALASSPHAANLTALEVQECTLSDVGILAVAASPHIGILTSLELFWCDVTDTGFDALVASGKLSGLTDLYLKEVDISGDAVLALLARPDAPALRCLALGVVESGLPFDDETIVALAACPALSQLESLDLGFNGLGDDAAVALAQSPHLTRLETLELGKNNIGRRGALALVAAAWPALQWLTLTDNVGYEDNDDDLFDEVPRAFYTALAARHPFVMV